LLVGDAAGFVSGSTGEGIYPAMVSAQCAAEVIQEAFRKDSLEGTLQVYNQRWKEILGGYLRYLPGDQKRDGTMKRLDYIFRSSLVCRVAAKAFLYGEGTGVRDLLRNLWGE
jgi:flavin-dependent dehydrogenase